MTVVEKVGLLGIPVAVLASVGLPNGLHACLLAVCLLLVLCTISIFCLVAVSVDRYWAILHPMAYSRNVRTKTAVVSEMVAIRQAAPCFVYGSKKKIAHSMFPGNAAISFKEA
ncbi:hypothetical protein J437_LFUL011914 [Ladona fulva]|uniref:G-protein coupled receptors family 1 profile domain-containing protein n=1 Tax=Ladona fulva TaxID=123851 RepID=A0A8K0JUD7_LADFU|nr:hypothetical protein J437_LFUL011914 [Ladona fulva]